MSRAVIDAAIGLLCCPVCAAGLVRHERTLRCPAGHSFDIARQGQVNLLGRAAPPNADTAAMVAARARFLGAGHYGPIRAEVSRLCVGEAAVVEVGAGTGYYLAGVLAGRPERPHLALDISPAACRASARAGQASAVADTWAGLPVASGCVQRLLAVFAPRNPAEFARILAPDGELLIVTPTPDHLAGLRARHGLLKVPAGKTARLDTELAAVGLQLAERRPISFELSLTATEVADLIAMGPNAFHTDRNLEPAGITTQAAVLVSRYRAGRNRPVV